jgi:radical SAM protein with 4Fe4S-binding SPASM domain
MTNFSLKQCIDHLHQTHDIVCQIDCKYSDMAVARVDLYSKIKQAYRESFQDNQRLIFVLEQDLYNTNSTTGSILQAIQIILQDIDISNFFVCVVTTNPDIDKEYQFIKDNISNDPVDFQVFKCLGNFDKITVEHIAMQGKIQSLKSVDFDKISNQHQNLLFVDPVFCMMPWVGINISTTSQVYPCCVTKSEFSIGNIKDHSIDEIWNAENIKNIRKSMLQGIPVNGCQDCYDKEKLKRPSSRMNFNRELAKHVHLIDSTDQSGNVPTTNIKYWDIRYNNLCNFACRSCGPDQSSSWYQVHNTVQPDKKITIPLLQIGNNQDEVYNQICQNISHVDTIYFAGGEPSMIENFYNILELLIDHNRKDVHLIYNINMSRLSLKQKSLLTLWNQFQHVSIGASLDAEGDRATYLRSGTVWKDIINNRLAIAQECPHVDFWVSATTGLINALHVPDFHQSWVSQGLIEPADFNIQLLFTPAYQSVLNAPPELKQKIQDRYVQHLEWLTPLDKTGRAVHGFNSVIEMCQQPTQYDSEKFWTQIHKLDQYHGTNLLETFPELQNVGL